ncbi:dihydroorotate dehydrogenase [Sulfodiicoccus acidiphilus]|uniref:Dihydroorotate dehydrogenase n=1 Tax=Sulfodiicoccus acidiphilus TaxID=1670455 RepID=A0A348B1B5_9CREN|nr:dihydroorotate dehydrogenase PyrD [Sulfodiicoccus acidiphilus]BBD71967.1 dihydroorotate dehydrogenase [Sulfodiicoccus acidiphilus]GGT91827.1 dihydroorotate dehydrogenase [Sulfodiicoccus acidiphilus]
MPELAGVSFRDPFVIASGIVPNHPELIRQFCHLYGPAGVTTKSFTLNPLDPHPPPTVFKLGDGCYINAIGLSNPGRDGLREINVPCRVIYSIAGSSPEEFGQLASLVPKGHLVELNLSSPNRRGLGESVAPMVREIVREVVGATQNPVLVKLGPWDNVIDLAGRALEAGAKGLTLINTVKGMAIDVYERRPILTYTTGGVSGKCIHHLAVRIVAQVFKEYQADVIGVGGVYSWEDAAELMLAGAKLVGVGTAIIDRGPRVLTQIREGFGKFLDKKGINATELVGAGVR